MILKLVLPTIDLMMRTKHDIYQYTDFRVFLEDRLNELKASDSKFSRRYISKKCGFQSTSYLKMIIDGSRNLTDANARKLTAALNLKKEEADFFLKLVHYNQAKTTPEKAEAFKSLRRSKRFTRVNELTLEQFDYMTKPLTLALREMVNYDDFQEDEAWIGKQLTFKASPKEIRNGIKKLVKLDLLERDDKGRLRVTKLHTATGDRLGSTPLRVYHMNMMKAAQNAMELPPEVRYFRGLTMSIPSEAYGDVIELYSQFLDKVRAVIDSSESVDSVYHMEMELFPLALKNSHGEAEK